LRFWPAVGSLFSGSSCSRTHFAPRGDKFGQADDVVGGPGEDERSADLREAAHLHLRETADRLRPAEAFLDALARPLADRVTEARGDLARNRGLARLAMLAQRPVDRDVRLNPARLQRTEQE
jgi:hypothetical protein